MRKQTAKITADRAEQLKKSSVRAGKSKASEIMRKVQNKEVKDGMIKIGKSGKSYNVYDAKSGTWKKGVVKAAAKPKVSGAEGPKRSVAPKKKPYTGGIIGRDVTPRTFTPPRKYGNGVSRSR